ncbi:MAG: hypothetical protein JWQ55_4494 [Rhodopila sp.]|jgi:hypothetical protein|nr:hypothetical protein [Rhodopila sp.]
MSASDDVVGDDFLLPPEAFVRRCAACCGLDDVALSNLDVAHLADAIRRGRPRLEILDVMRARRDPTDPRLRRPNIAAFSREFAGNVILDVLLRYAPADEAAFVRFAFGQIVNRPPTSRELLSLDFDLRCGRLDRRAVVDWLLARAQIEGVHVVVSDHTAPDRVDGGGDDRTWIANGQTLDAQGRDRIVFVKQHPGHGWLLSPGFWRQPVETTDDGWAIRPGWLLLGPKLNLAGGEWRLEVDVLQHDDATILIDVVANAGIDVLAKVLFDGPTHCALRFEIAKWHHFVEVRLLKPEEPTEKCWVRIRNLSLVRVG